MSIKPEKPYKDILFEVKDQVAWITINRPRVLNAFREQTLDEMIEIQETAYMYEIDIYGNADAATLALLDRQLTALEPARSSHIIRNNVTPPSI